MSITIKLVAGPFDGFTEREIADELPPIIYAEPCHRCCCHLWAEPSERSEPYHREREGKGWVVYVWRDLTLDVPSRSVSAVSSPSEPIAA